MAASHSKTAGKTSRAASRKGRPFRSHEKRRVASDRGGLVGVARPVVQPRTSLFRAQMLQQP
jgi:hypothetical protein